MQVEELAPRTVVWTMSFRLMTPSLVEIPYAVEVVECVITSFLLYIYWLVFLESPSDRENFGIVNAL